MKVAFLFAGQYRKISKKLFVESLLNLTDGLDYSIYSFCWKEIGRSLNHSNSAPELTTYNNIEGEIQELFNGFNLKNSSFESFIDFKNNLSPIYKNIQNDKKYHYGTVNSLPQIYSITKCYELIENNLDNYDLIFRCRYDTLFFHPIKIYPLEIIARSNDLYNLNFGRAYYPKRVYDIFFGGSPKAISFLKKLWRNLPELINHSFENGLDRRDACRILYIGATLNKTNCQSFDTRICDIYRMSDNHNLEKYVIKSHFSRLVFRKRIFTSYLFFYEWLLKRKMKNHEILKSFFIFFILLPFSYLKRIKYLKNFLN